MNEESLKAKLQQIADLRLPIKEDESFYEGIDFEQMIMAIMNEGREGMPTLEEVLEPIADKFAEAHGGLIQKAVGLGEDLGKELV